jgi:hypothetical protein
VPFYYFLRSLMDLSRSTLGGRCLPRIARPKSSGRTAVARRWPGRRICWSGELQFETPKRMYPKDLIEYRRGAQVIERSKPQRR